MYTSEKNWQEELSDPKKWTTEDEVYLLYCALDNKPVGIDKHLQMSIIWSRFRALTKKNVNSDVLWKKLGEFYNLKHLDELESLPFKNKVEDFLLPVEIIPEYYIKFLSEEEKKNIDFSGQYKKFISVTEPDDEDHEYKGKLRGSEKMKWFECPQYYKTIEKATKKIESKAKFDSNESSNDSSSDLKPLRKYGKATEITSGSMLTISVPPQLLDELDDNTGDDDNYKEDASSTKLSTADTKDDAEKLRKRKRASSKKGDPSDDAESPAPKQLARASKSVESTLSNTRLRKSSIASHEASSGTETEKDIEDNSRIRRRCSTRVPTSESKPETPKLESVTKTSDIKRKSTTRR